MVKERYAQLEVIWVGKMKNCEHKKYAPETLRVTNNAPSHPFRSYYPNNYTFPEARAIESQCNYWAVFSELGEGGPSSHDDDDDDGGGQRGRRSYGGRIIPDQKTTHRCRCSYSSPRRFHTASNQLNQRA